MLKIWASRRSSKGHYWAEKQAAEWVWLSAGLGFGQLQWKLVDCAGVVADAWGGGEANDEAAKKEATLTKLLGTMAAGWSSMERK